MLSPAKSHESLTSSRLAGKLLLTTALVAVTAGYGWWQHDQMSRQQAAVMAAMQVQAPSISTPAPAPSLVQPQAQALAPPQAAAPQAAPDEQSASPKTSAANAPPDGSKAAISAKSTQTAMAAPLRSVAASAAPGAAPGDTVLLPATPPPDMPPIALTGMEAIRNFIPTENSPPLPPVTGTPDANAAPPIPVGAHLEDGEYRSDKIQFEWGDLRVRIVVAGGRITTVQIMTYPDHRSQSLYLIQLADPILTSEVIKTQQAKVDVVSSATNTSYAFQDAIASAIVKATR